MLPASFRAQACLSSDCGTRAADPQQPWAGRRSRLLIPAPPSRPPRPGTRRRLQRPSSRGWQFGSAWNLHSLTPTRPRTPRGPLLNVDLDCELPNLSPPAPTSPPTATHSHPFWPSESAQGKAGGAQHLPWKNKDESKFQ